MNDYARGTDRLRASQKSRSRRVLLIDDDLDLAEALMTILSLNGHDVVVAHEGAEGLDLARASSPEIVLCDLSLQDMGGWEVARAIRRDPSMNGVYLVALSGYGKREDRDRALAAGFDEHIAKPVNEETLERVLARSAPSSLQRVVGSSQSP